MDPFATYAKQANTIVSAPARLLGPIKTRAEARLRYAELVDALNACSSTSDIEALLTREYATVQQFAAELEWLWNGDDTFRGLRKEIEWARARVDVGLDFPRWEPGYSEEGLGL